MIFKGLSKWLEQWTNEGGQEILEEVELELCSDGWSSSVEGSNELS